MDHDHMEPDDRERAELEEQARQFERETVEKLEKRLGVRPGFFHELRKNQSDWSFVVRVHAFLEGALRHAIAQEIGRPELLPVVSRMQIQGGGATLIRMAKALGILKRKEETSFLEAFTDLRNDFAHGVDNLERTLAEYAQALPPEKFESLLGRLGMKPTGSANPPLAETRAVQPILAGLLGGILWWSTQRICINLLLTVESAELKQRLNEQLRELEKKLLRSSGSDYWRWLIPDLLPPSGGLLGNGADKEERNGN